MKREINPRRTHVFDGMKWVGKDTERRWWYEKKRGLSWSNHSVDTECDERKNEMGSPMLC